MSTSWDFFWPTPPDAPLRVERVVSSLRTFAPRRRFALVTCVHGLHYVGDKLGALVRMRSWLAPGGRIAAHLDLATVRIGNRPARAADLRALGLSYTPRRRLVTASGPGPGPGPDPAASAPRFVGAETGVETYTGQPGVLSHYRT